MDRLWAPWRINYIQAKKRPKGCLFCQARVSAFKKKYVLIKNKHSLSMLNIFPYNNGHIMIAPNRHVGDIARLNDKELADLFFTLRQAKLLLDKTLKPQGYNIGINLGSVAGAGIAGHLHIHIVPRWKADVNFMPAVYNTKVISQSLDELYKRLNDAKSKSDKRIRR